MQSTPLLGIGLVALIGGGCAGNPGNQPERGPNGTIAYHVKIESSEPGARVEVNEEFVGVTPTEIRVWGDKDGTFHNFGTSDFTIRVFPVHAGQTPQTKVFRTGGWFAQEDRIPQRLFFDLDLKGQGGFSVEPGKPRY